MRNTIAQSKQQGFILFVALIALLFITMAAVGLVRSTDTATQVASSLSFKQGATNDAEIAVNAAITWLAAQSQTSLASNNANAGYYATQLSTVDFTGQQTPGTSSDDVNWSGSGAGVRAALVNAGAADTNTGNSYAYIISRLCDQADMTINNPANSCLTNETSSSGSSTYGGSRYGNRTVTSSLQGYYKVVVRVSGPKNTVSFIESVLVL